MLLIMLAALTVIATCMHGKVTPCMHMQTYTPHSGAPSRSQETRSLLGSGGINAGGINAADGGAAVAKPPRGPESLAMRMLRCWDASHNMQRLLTPQPGGERFWWLVVLVVGGWWLVVGGWWLVVGGWWLVVGGWWLVVGGWWLVVVVVVVLLLLLCSCC